MALQPHYDWPSIMMKLPRRMASISSIMFFNSFVDIKCGLSLVPTCIFLKLSLHFYIIWMYSFFPDIGWESWFSSFIECRIFTFFNSAFGFWLLRIEVFVGPFFWILSRRFLIFSDSLSISYFCLWCSINFKISMWRWLFKI